MMRWLVVGTLALVAVVAIVLLVGNPFLPAGPAALPQGVVGSHGSPPGGAGGGGGSW